MCFPWLTITHRQDAVTTRIRNFFRSQKVTWLESLFWQKSGSFAPLRNLQKEGARFRAQKELKSKVGITRNPIMALAGKSRSVITCTHLRFRALNCGQLIDASTTRGAERPHGLEVHAARL
jgi:hypothetical protein